MSVLSDLQDAVKALSDKVDTHNTNDAAVVAAKDKEIADLKAQLAAGPQGVAEADLIPVTASVQHIAEKLA